MYESAKLSQLKRVFESKYDINLFQSFAKEFFNEPEMLQATRKTGIWKEYSDHVTSYSLIAKYTDRMDNELIILSVELKKSHSVDRARTLQRNFISKVLEQQGYDAAIVAFYVPDETTWRLSFVRLDYTFDDKGLSLDLTPARRYSYLVGEGEPNHTSQKQLLEIFQNDDDNPILDEIEGAFSVEKVTKDFYKQYELKYLELKEYLEGNAAFAEETARLGFQVEQFSEQFAKKLMGQLAFLYFLQKRGWLGVRILPENRRIPEKDYWEIYNSLDDVHKSILDKTFIKTKDGQRKLTSKSLYSLNDHEAELFSNCFVGSKFEESWGNGNKTFIREIFTFCEEKTNQNFFDDFLEPLFYEALNKKRKNQYFQRFNCKVPFLNGGLFEPLEGYHWRDVNFNIPNDLFSNIKGKGRESNGILDIFDRFNFTINEAEPLEKDVAVDPEMLGKIFENLLDVKDRKSKGAFYTPREIVHHMCQESLTNYLSNQINIPKKDIKEFILYGDLIKDVDSRSGAGYSTQLSIKQTVFDNIVHIDNALKNVRVADPAVGSGAFPLGMLGEIVRARNNITDYLVKKDKEGYFGIIYGEETIRKKRSSYYLKWETIKNSIFAVDVEASAVDIAKLRLWLSVIVEQEINDDTPIPHPLPNLDNNILVGNSLVDEYDGMKLFDENIINKSTSKKSGKKEKNSAVQLSLLIDNTDELLKEMFSLQDGYFDEENEHKKRELKNKIDQIREDLIEYKLQQDGNEEALLKYKEMKKKKQKPYFLWMLEFAKVFREKEGFDIVIGNPPYVDSEEMVRTSLDFRQYCVNKFESARGNWDLFVVFIEHGINLLNSGGTISYIVPNKLISADYTQSLRRIIQTYNVLELRDYSEVNVFSEADVYPVVFSVEKSEEKQPVTMTVMKSKTEVDWENVIAVDLFYQDINWDRYFTKDAANISIINKLLSYPKLKDLYTVKGAATVGEAYKIKEVIKEYDDKDATDELYKFINTGTIDKFRSLWDKQKTRYIKGSYLKPIVSKSDIISISKTRFEEASSPKVIIAGMTKELECYLDLQGEYLAGKSTSIILAEGDDLKLLVSILNSKLLTFFFKIYFSSLSLAGGYLRVGPPQLKQLPIADTTLEIKEIISKKLDNLCELVEESFEENLPIIQSKQKEIDEIIYSIYGLNKEEINIIENS